VQEQKAEAFSIKKESQCSRGAIATKHGVHIELDIASTCATTGCRLGTLGQLSCNTGRASAMQVQNSRPFSADSRPFSPDSIKDVQFETAVPHGEHIASAAYVMLPNCGSLEQFAS
jgi:hypothetical protein